MPSQQKPHLGLEDLKDAMPVAEVSADVAVKEDTQAPAKPPMGFGAIAQQVPASSAVPVANMRVSSKMVMKRDGTRAPFNADQINKSIERATYGLANPLEKVMQIASETELTIYDGITTEEMDQATINAALQNAQYDLDYDKIATRLLVKTIYKKVLGTYDTKEELVTMHKAHFQHYVRLGVELNLLDKRLKQFDLDELGRYLKLERDEFYKYSGMSTMMDRYLIKDTDGKPLETPQYFWMRIAMAMAIPEKDKMGMAKKFYDKMSKLEYLSAGSTNIGAGTTRFELLSLADRGRHVAHRKDCAGCAHAFESDRRHRSRCYQASCKRLDPQVQQYGLVRTCAFYAHHRLGCACRAAWGQKEGCTLFLYGELAL
jgi:transcriptional regulator NrdR family protein